jgi:hypothetical protein
VWVLAGCSTVVVLTAAGVAYGIYSFVQGVEHGSRTCLPSDFPTYPGAVYAEFTYDLNGAYPGNTCHVVLQSSDDVAAVAAFYQSKLNTGAWRVTPSGNQAGTLTFQPTGSTVPFGTVQVTFGNTRTEITIDLFTSTCLPLRFPRYPGSKFGGQSTGVDVTKFCHVVFVSDDSIAAVTTWYENELHTGSWQVTSRAAGQVGFRLRNGKRTLASGTVTLVVSGERTEIKVDASS